MTYEFLEILGFYHLLATYRNNLLLNEPKNKNIQISRLPCLVLVLAD